MLEFGTAEGLGMKIAGFLELERRLARDRKRWSAPNGDETVSAREWIERLIPLERGREREPFWKALDCCAQGIIALPLGDDSQQHGQAGDEGFRCGDAELRPRGQRQHDVASSGERAVRIIDNRRGERA